MMTKDIIKDMTDHMVKTIDTLRREYSKDSQLTSLDIVA